MAYLWRSMVTLSSRNVPCGQNLSVTLSQRHVYKKVSDIQPTISRRPGGRAWNVHPLAFDRLRRDVLVKPKFREQIVTSVVDLSGKSTTTVKIEDSSLKDINSSDFKKLLRNMCKDNRISDIKVIEQECCRRLNGWNIELILFAMDAFYVAQYRAPMFYNAVFEKLDILVTSTPINSKDIVQVLFYASLYRRCPTSMMRNFEKAILQSCEQFTDNELGLICHAFFTCNTCFERFDLIERIGTRLLAALPEKQFLPYMISNYMKALRHAGLDSSSFYQRFGDSLCHIMDKRNIPLAVLLDTFRAFYSAGYVHENFSKKVQDSVSSALKTDKTNLRFKDLVCAVWGSLNLQLGCPSTILEALSEKLNTGYKELSRLYPERFLEGLVCLVLCGRYPKDAISHALSPDFLEMKHERPLEQTFQTLLLDEALGVYCAHYLGNRLPKSYFANLVNGSICDVQKQIEMRKGLAKVAYALQHILGRNCAKCHSILSFSQVPDLELRLNRDGEPLPLAENGDVFKHGDGHPENSENVLSITDRLTENRGIHGLDRGTPEPIHLVPASDSTKDVRQIVIKVLGWNQLLLNKPILSAIHAFELNLLEKKGYEVITVTPLQASQLEDMTHDSQLQFVRDNILAKLNCS